MKQILIKKQILGKKVTNIGKYFSNRPIDGIDPFDLNTFWAELFFRHTATLGQQDSNYSKMSYIHRPITTRKEKT